jgi:alpha-N-arabinofuranosidase
MVFLGGRDVGGYALLGRETFLAPVTWEDGWPVVNNRRPIELEMQPAPALAAAAWPWPFGRDEFEGAALRPAWVFVRGIPAGWSLTSRLGWLALRGGAETLNSRGATPVFVARRMQHLETSLQTRLDFNPQNSTEEAGLALREDEQNHYALVITGQAGSRQVVLRRRVEGKSKEVARRAIGPGIVTLKIKTHPHQFDFYAGLEGENSALIGSLPAEGVKTRAFTGLMVGLYASGNGQPGTTTAYFDWFDYQPQ